jgi:hypothetical protein
MLSEVIVEAEQSSCGGALCSYSVCKIRCKKKYEKNPSNCSVSEKISTTHKLFSRVSYPIVHF